MTAIVGVLNKRAVAIAADSAVTVGDTHKVMNTGNKIFSLSKFAPVGLAIYGTASLMDTPWEVIIKCYRRELNRKKFLHLREYVEDFLSYLRKHEFFASKIVQKRYLGFQITSFLAICVDQAKKRPNYEANPSQAILEELDDWAHNQMNADLIDDFKNFSYDNLVAFAREELLSVLNRSKVLNATLHFDTFAMSFYHYMIVANLVRGHESGLVFVGYGEEEIYPCLYNVIINIGLEHRLQYRYGEITEITNEETIASIQPFAQAETTKTVIGGINPTFFNIIANNFFTILGNFRTQMENVARTYNATAVATQIANIKIRPISDTFTKTMREQFFANYSRPLIETVRHLSISDMANVAESLVALTSLVNRMSPKEESVGGPVDVAVISKGDGLVWIKRKHYFDPNLNSQFFNNYNNE